MKFGNFKPCAEFPEMELYEFHFENGYGVYVIGDIYGELFEMELFKQNSQEPYDVLEWLTANEVTEKLTEISNRKRR